MTPFRVLCYNIQRGGESRLPTISRVIRAHCPDAVALVEANDRANAEILAAELGMDVVIGEANSPHHLAWLTRSSPTDARNHRLPSLSRTLLEVTLRWEDNLVHLFATHLAPTWEAPGARRLMEADAVLSVLAPHIGIPTLLMGDFNALHPGDRVGVPPPREAAEVDQAHSAPRQVIQRFIDAGLVDCYRAVHSRNPGYTYSSDSPWARIDFIFASRRIAARLDRCEVITDGEAVVASDHLPVWATFS